MHRYFIGLLMLLGCVAPAWAFVSKLSPYTTTAANIPCHQMRAVVTLYAQGKFSAGQLANILKREFLEPAGETWSAEDMIDNQNLLNLVQSITHTDPRVQQLARESVGLLMEGLCAGGEIPIEEMSQPNYFRQFLGIPTQ